MTCKYNLLGEGKRGEGRNEENMEKERRKNFHLHYIQQFSVQTSLLLNDGLLSLCVSECDSWLTGEMAEEVQPVLTLSERLQLGLTVPKLEGFSE